MIGFVIAVAGGRSPGDMAEGDSGEWNASGAPGRVKKR